MTPTVEEFRYARCQWVDERWFRVCGVPAGADVPVVAALAELPRAGEALPGRPDLLARWFSYRSEGGGRWTVRVEYFARKEQ